MKTKNNVQKTVLKSTTLCICLVLINLLAGAQNFWKASAGSNGAEQFAFAMVERNTENSFAANTANKFRSYLEEETESYLLFENWMFDENSFSSVIIIEDEVEGFLSLEDWMTNDLWFSSYSMYLTSEKEEALELENWMTDANHFKIPVFQIIEEKENKLEIEDWMLNKDLFYYADK